MSTPVKKNQTSNDKKSQSKSTNKPSGADRSDARRSTSKNGRSKSGQAAKGSETVDDAGVPNKAIVDDGLTVDKTSDERTGDNQDATSSLVLNETVELDVPPPPQADDATSSARRPPASQVSGRLRRELEPVASNVSSSAALAARRLGSKLGNVKSNRDSSDAIYSEAGPKTDAANKSGARSLLPMPFTKRVGGVAPFVTPRRRASRSGRLRELSQRGFVPLSPGKQKLRHRILPRSVIGIATMLMCVGVGAAFSGAAFYAYYDDRLAENERTVARFVTGFDQQFTDAAGALDDLRVGAIEEIRTELGPLEDQVTDAEGVIALPQNIGESVWMLETRDEDGQIANGAAFAIVGHQGGTALVTSYQLTIASTTAPSPGIDIVKGNRRIPAQLWAWDIERDLALVVVEEVIPPLEFAGETAQIAAVGGRVFAMSGVGGQGATASPGVLLDHSLAGLQHTVPVGTLFTGGPLVDGEGRVIGVAASNYRPYGIDPGAVAQAPDIRSVCAVVLQCSEIREEVIVEVANDETDAPERGDEPVREIEDSEEDVEGEQIEGEGGVGDEATVDPNEEPADGSDSDATESESADTDSADSDSADTNGADSDSAESGDGGSD